MKVPLLTSSSSFSLTQCVVPPRSPPRSKTPKPNIMKLALFSTLFASAAAFQVAPVAKQSTALRVNELEIGVTDPLGVFDPLGWLETQPEAFERRRAVERKHGRIAMVAVVGMLVHNAGIELPGSLTLDGSVKFSDISDGFTGLFEVPAFGLAQILLGTGLMEVSS